MRGLVSACIAIFVLANSVGCARFAGRMVTAPPNRVLHPCFGRMLIPAAKFDHQYDVTVGPPEARLKISLVEPRPARQTPRGTIIVLHGIYSTSERMYPFAEPFARAGYRVAFVDLRAHGRSTGSECTYGVFESRDVSQVLNDLDWRGWLAHPVGVCGHSLGGSTAIQLAARDTRVRSVVAMAAHVNMENIVKQTVHTRVPLIRRIVSEEWLESVVQEAGRSAGFDPRMANSIAAMQQGTAPVLLIHGANDRFVLPYHSTMLHDAAPQRARLMIMPNSDHTGMLEGQRETASNAAVAFFAETLTP